MSWQEIARLLIASIGLDRSPIGMHYQKSRPADAVGFKTETGCIFALLKAVEKGRTIAVGADCGCFGGRFYCGFAGGPFEGHDEYVSRGEHYLKTPDLCRRVWNEHPPPAAADKWLVFQRLEAYTGTEPEVVVFLARPDAVCDVFTPVASNYRAVNSTMTCGLDG